MNNDLCEKCGVGIEEAPGGCGCKPECKTALHWNDVKVKLPKEDEWYYLGSNILQRTTWGIYMNGKFVNPDLCYAEIREVTHWMELPEPPK